MQRRRTTDPHTGPMSVYEVHLGSWRKDQGYRDLAEHLVSYVADLGFTHVELLPVMEHPYGPSWGYQVTGYYAPTARFGSPDDFRYLVDRLHQAGIGVILDWVPAHFPRDAWALAKFDGQALYEHPDPRRGDQPDWGTHIFDFGRMQVRNFLVANAIYWCEEFHVDGLRVDAVASMLYLDYSRKDGQWLPNQFGGRENLEAIGLLQETNATTYKRVPGIVTVAEESTSWPGVTKPTDAGGLGFGLKWNMGWMNDTLRYIGQDPVHRQYHHLLTFSLMYAYSENDLLPISHDEVVHGGSPAAQDPGQPLRPAATLRAYLAYIWSHPGKQLLFMGSEFAQEAEWADGRELDWWLLDHAALPRPQPRQAAQRRLQGQPGAVGAGLLPLRASSGSTPTTTPGTASRTCASAARTGTAGRWWPSSSTSTAWHASRCGSVSPAQAGGGSSSTRAGTTSSARPARPTSSSTRRTSPGTTSPTRSRSASRRSAVWLAPVDGGGAQQ